MPARRRPSEAAGGRVAGGKIGTTVEERVPAAPPGRDQLKVSPQAGKGQVAEDVVSRDKALREAQTRITELEKTLQDLQRALALKGGGQAPQAPPRAPTGRNRRHASAGNHHGTVRPPRRRSRQRSSRRRPSHRRRAADGRDGAGNEGTGAAQGRHSGTRRAAEDGAAGEGARAEGGRRKAPAKSSSGFFDDLFGSTPGWVIGGGAFAALAGIAALIAARRRRTVKFEDSIIGGTDIKTNTVFGSTGGGVVNTGENSLATDFSREGLGSIDTDEVDPIAEAEVYLAYGRDAQAEEILKDALKKDPQRQEIYLKLLEIHAQHNKPSAFETVAAELYSVSQGKGEAWQKAVTLGRQLDPNNPMFGEGGGAAAAAAAAAAGAGIAMAAGAAAADKARDSSRGRRVVVHREGDRGRRCARLPVRRGRLDLANRQHDPGADRGDRRGRARVRGIREAARSAPERSKTRQSPQRLRVSPSEDLEFRLDPNTAGSLDEAAAKLKPRKSRSRPRSHGPRRRSISTSSTSRSAPSTRRSRIRRRRCSTASGTTPRPSSISRRRTRKWATSKGRARSCRKCCTKATTRRRPKRRCCSPSSAERGTRGSFSGAAEATSAARCFFEVPSSGNLRFIMRLALGLEYCGRTFTGWQSQPDGRGVQDALERALAVIADAKVGTIAAGRTDAGVHATMQVVHFDADAVRPDTAWVRGVNSNLPDDVAVLWARPVASEFHARFDALAAPLHLRAFGACRASRRSPPGASAGTIAASMSRRCEQAAVRARRHARLLGVPRRGVPGEVSDAHAVRACRSRPSGDVLRFDFCANAYLHHMIRNIVGALVYVGAGKHPPAWIGELLAGRDRTRAAPTFAPDGLYFTGVEYDAKWGLPPTRRPVALPLGLMALPRCLAHASRSAASLASRTRSPRRARAPTRSGSSCGRARRASSRSSRRARSRRACRRSYRSSASSSIPTPEHVRAALAAVPLDLLQFHGAEAPELCRGFGRRYLKAVPVAANATEVDLLEYATRYPDACGLLFDAPPSGGLPGGTGQTFDWQRAAAETAAAAGAVGRAHCRERRRGDSPDAAVGGGCVERRRSDRRRRQDDQGQQGSGADRRFHRGSAQCR